MIAPRPGRQKGAAPATGGAFSRRDTAYQTSPNRLREVAPWRLGEFEAAGGLWASLRDMARDVAFQLAAYPPRDDADRGPQRGVGFIALANVQNADLVAINAEATKILSQTGGSCGASSGPVRRSREP